MGYSAVALYLDGHKKMHFKSIDYEMLLAACSIVSRRTLIKIEEANQYSFDRQAADPVWQPHRPVFYLQHLGTTLLMYMKGSFNPYCSQWSVPYLLLAI